MKRILLMGSLLLGLISAGCMSDRSAFDATQQIQGTWTSDQSVAVYEIKMVDGAMTVRGHSGYSGKELMIGDVSWDGSILRFTSFMPSTDMKVLHENRLEDADTMISETVGNAAHRVVWKKADS